MDDTWLSFYGILILIQILLLWYISAKKWGFVLKKRRIKLLFLIMLIISVFLIKFVYIPRGIEEVDRNPDYLDIGRWFTGQNIKESHYTYQFPPLWSIITIPSCYMDVETYLVLISVILGVLIIIPLTLILQRYVGFYYSSLISAFVVITNVIFAQVAQFRRIYGNPIILSAFLFAWFIYFFRDIHENKKAYWMSSLFYMLLIATKYVFIFMLPFIIAWMLMRKRTYLIAGYSKIKSIIMWGIPSLLVFLIWSIRNMILHGYSVKGAIGGYHNAGGRMWLDVGGKLNNISTIFEPRSIMIYYLVFLITTIMIFIYSKKYEDIIEKYYNRKERQFFYLLILNFAVFLFFPAFMYGGECLNYRYLAYFTPVYLAIAILTATIFIREYLIQSTGRKKEP